MAVQTFMPNQWHRGNPKDSATRGVLSTGSKGGRRYRQLSAALAEGQMMWSMTCHDTSIYHLSKFWSNTSCCGSVP
jgi:hypothetical protein